MPGGSYGGNGQPFHVSYSSIAMRNRVRPDRDLASTMRFTATLLPILPEKPRPSASSNLLNSRLLIRRYKNFSAETNTKTDQMLPRSRHQNF